MKAKKDEKTRYRGRKERVLMEGTVGEVRRKEGRQRRR